MEERGEVLKGVCIWTINMCNWFSNHIIRSDLTPSSETYWSMLSFVHVSLSQILSRFENLRTVLMCRLLYNCSYFFHKNNIILMMFHNVLLNTQHILYCVNGLCFISSLNTLYNVICSLINIDGIIFHIIFYLMRTCIHVYKSNQIMYIDPNLIIIHIRIETYEYSM